VPTLPGPLAGSQLPQMAGNRHSAIYGPPPLLRVEAPYTGQPLLSLRNDTQDIMNNRLQRLPTHSVSSRTLVREPARLACIVPPRGRTYGLHPTPQATRERCKLLVEHPICGGIRIGYRFWPKGSTRVRRYPTVLAISATKSHIQGRRSGRTPGGKSWGP